MKKKKTIWDKIRNETAILAHQMKSSCFKTKKDKLKDRNSKVFRKYLKDIREDY